MGSSKINKRFPWPFPFPKKEASFTRCASPPESVSEDCPNLIYPKPTSLNGCIFLAISAPLISFFFPEVFSFPKKAMASSTLISNTSKIFLSLYFTSNTSCLNLFPPQTSQVKCTSAKNCISTTCSPSPLHASHLPPSTLKEKCLG